MARVVRRIVTGHHRDGRSTVLIDGHALNVKQRQAGNASTLLWVTDEVRDNETMRRDFGIGAAMVFIDAQEPAAILNLEKS